MRRVSTWKENDWLVLVSTNDNDNEDVDKGDNKVNLSYEKSPHFDLNFNDNKDDNEDENKGGDKVTFDMRRVPIFTCTCFNRW